jgi:uncharacterized protein
VTDRANLPALKALMDQEEAAAFIKAKLKQELPRGRTYHSYGHTMDVHNAAVDIAKREGINGEDLTLLRTAALFHDSGFIQVDLEHEEASCQLARKHLPRFGYTHDQVERVCGMIMATRIPQSPHDLLSRILCDADLDYLGRDDFFRIGNTLFEELKSYGVVETEREWNELQLRFLESHEYFTSTNQNGREHVKRQHIAQVKRWLAEHV